MSACFDFMNRKDIIFIIWIVTNLTVVVGTHVAYPGTHTSNLAQGVWILILALLCIIKHKSSRFANWLEGKIGT
jgi:hypothetical protein